MIHDHQRYTKNREGKKGAGSVLMAVFREEDVRASKKASDSARSPIVISQLQPADRNPSRSRIFQPNLIDFLVAMLKRDNRE